MGRSWCMFGLFHRSETPDQVYEGLIASQKKVADGLHSFMGPEFHHIFKHQNFLGEDDEEPEFEEAWTDTFYDLFLVAMMSKVTRMVLQGITSTPFDNTVGVATSNTTSGVQDFQNFWHYGCVISFILVFYALWRALLSAQMQSRSNEKEDMFTNTFMLFQLILVLVLCLGVFHIEKCPEASEESGESSSSEGGAERRLLEEEEACVMYGAKYFGAAVMLAHLLIMLWHTIMAFHPKPRMPIEDEEALGKIKGKEHEIRVAKAVQKLTRRYQLLYAFKAVIWIVAGLLHWAGAFKENDAKATCLTYFFAYVMDILVTYLVGKCGNFQHFRRRYQDETDERWRWLTYDDIEKKAEKDNNHFSLPIHVPFYTERHKAFMAIAFGESILQLTGANSNEPWKPNYHSMVTAICGIIIIYSLASMYFHTFTGMPRDHPIWTNAETSVFWSELQPVVIVNLCLLGAAFEAAWGSNAEYNSDAFDAATTYGYGIAVKIFVLACFMIATTTCIMAQIGQDRQRALAAYPMKGFLVFFFAPTITTAGILVPYAFDDWRTAKIEVAWPIIAAVVFFDYIYHVRVMAPLFFTCTNFSELKLKEKPDDCALKLRFKLENLKKAQTEIVELIEETEESLKQVESRATNKTSNPLVDEQLQEVVKFSGPSAKGPGPKQDVENVVLGNL